MDASILLMACEEIGAVSKLRKGSGRVALRRGERKAVRKSDWAERVRKYAGDADDPKHIVLDINLEYRRAIKTGRRPMTLADLQPGGVYHDDLEAGHMDFKRSVWKKLRNQITEKQWIFNHYKDLLRPSRDVEEDAPLVTELTLNFKNLHFAAKDNTSKKVLEQ